MVELLGEPFYVLATINLRFRLRVVMDTAPLLTKALVTLLCVSGWAGPTLASLPPALIFSASQLALATASCTGYWLAGLQILHEWRQQQQQHATSNQRMPAAKEGGQRQQADGPQQGAKTGQGGGIGSAKRGFPCEKEMVTEPDRRGGKGLFGWGPSEREALATSGIFAMQAVSGEQRLPSLAVARSLSCLNCSTGCRELQPIATPSPGVKPRIPAVNTQHASAVA